MYNVKKKQNNDNESEILKQAFDEWLDKKWASFGKWTAKGIAATLFGYIMYYISTHGGFWK